MFDIFYRENRTESDIYGSGIGMSIVKNIVEGHQGIIDVKSKIHEGTTITISLPIE
ncbi:ATP-binding protein [Bacillus sp. DNRA2]|uniref:ATP-binding protein n=1 Tax=Bacillus sp. DNRA2 TaxID=2723053 RepID=UPI0032B74C05